jgi:hypothetical protein
LFPTPSTTPISATNLNPSGSGDANPAPELDFSNAPPEEKKEYDHQSKIIEEVAKGQKSRRVIYSENNEVDVPTSNEANQTVENTEGKIESKEKEVPQAVTDFIYNSIKGGYVLKVYHDQKMNDEKEQGLVYVQLLKEIDAEITALTKYSRIFTSEDTELKLIEKLRLMFEKNEEFTEIWFEASSSQTPEEAITAYLIELGGRVHAFHNSVKAYVEKLSPPSTEVQPEEPPASFVTPELVQIISEEMLVPQSVVQEELERAELITSNPSVFNGSNPFELAYTVAEKVVDGVKGMYDKYFVRHIFTNENDPSLDFYTVDTVLSELKKDARQYDVYIKALLHNAMYWSRWKYITIASSGWTPEQKESSTIGRIKYSEVSQNDAVSKMQKALERLVEEEKRGNEVGTLLKVPWLSGVEGASPSEVYDAWAGAETVEALKKGYGLLEDGKVMALREIGPATINKRLKEIESRAKWRGRRRWASAYLTGAVTVGAVFQQLYGFTTKHQTYNHLLFQKAHRLNGVDAPLPEYQLDTEHLFPLQAKYDNTALVNASLTFKSNAPMHQFTSDLRPAIADTRLAEARKQAVRPRGMATELYEVSARNIQNQPTDIRRALVGHQTKIHKEKAAMVKWIGQGIVMVARWFPTVDQGVKNFNNWIEAAPAPVKGALQLAFDYGQANSKHGGVSWLRNDTKVLSMQAEYAENYKPHYAKDMIEYVNKMGFSVDSKEVDLSLIDKLASDLATFFGFRIIPVHTSLTNLIMGVDSLLCKTMEGKKRYAPDIKIKEQAQFLEVFGIVREFQDPRFVEGSKYGAMFRWLIHFQPNNQIRSDAGKYRTAIMLANEDSFNIAGNLGTFGGSGYDVDTVQMAADMTHNYFYSTLFKNPDAVHIQIGNWFGGDTQLSKEALDDYWELANKIGTKHEAALSKEMQIEFDNQDILLMIDFAERMFRRQVRMTAWILQGQKSWNASLIDENTPLNSAIPDAASFVNQG